MFSGLIQALGRVEKRKGWGEGVELTVSHPWRSDPLILGESVAVNGACLTVVAASSVHFTCQVSGETLRRSTLGKLSPGEEVNLERALRLQDRLGGHWVLGHVDATAQVVRLEERSGFRTVRFSLPRELAPEVAEKGSVALDGISLTVSQVGESWFEVVLIPATWERTTARRWRPGWWVNLETDVLAKYVRRALEGLQGKAIFSGWGRAED